jgi:hypothetical protein
VTVWPSGYSAALLAGSILVCAFHRFFFFLRHNIANTNIALTYKSVFEGPSNSTSVEILKQEGRFGS